MTDLIFLAKVYETIREYALNSWDFRLDEKSPGLYVWLIDTSDTIAWGASSYEEITEETLKILEECAQKLEDSPQLVRVLFASVFYGVEPQVAWKRHIPKDLYPIFWKEN